MTMVNRRPDELVGRMDSGEEGEDELDFAKIKRFLGFFLRAPRRHPTLSIAVFVVAVGIAACLVAWLPRTYTSELRVVAHRSIVLQPHDGAAPLPDPTLGVIDDVMKRDNLVGIIKDLDLVRRWDESRPPMLRLKDSIFRGPESSTDPLRAMVGVLDKRLTVWTDKETSSISMKVDW
ncbi:MAG: hypothetical protein JOZ69_24535, partial [Myxococcales bacterium]|nr:hypothetical protein [Myxococcales bacterium]